MKRTYWINDEEILGMDLRGVHTRVLLKYKDGLQASWRSEGARMTPEKEKSYEAALTKLYLELNTREHIPNKKEAKAIRQIKAKKHG